MKYARIATTALALALATSPLVACGSQQAAGTNDDAASTNTSQPAALDPSGWKTLGDAFAAQTEPMAAANDENYYVSVFRAGDSTFRVVARMDAETRQRLDNLEIDPEDIWTPEQKAVASLPVQSVEDLTDKVLSQDELDAFVGKTGKDLVDEGFEFESYYMYGGEQTGATFAKDYLAYGFVFDVAVPGEEAPEDEGASVMDAKVLEAESHGAADAAVDPTLVE